jgi:hypothetical protein
MSAKSPTEFAGQVLLKEYERLCTDIRSIESANEKILGLGFTLIGLGATAGIAQEVAPIFFVLPIAVVGIIAYAAVSYLCIFSMGGYKRHLEDLLNAQAGETLLVWERLVRLRERSSVNGHALRGIYLVISVSIFAISILQLSEHYGLKVAWAMGALLFVLVSAVYVGIRQMNSVFDRTYAKAKELHKRGSGT